MKSNRTEVLGLIAGALTTTAFIPGVIAVWALRPQPAKSISLLMYIIISAGVAMWLVYGIKIKARPVWIANSITLALALSILAYKLIYG